MTDIWQHKKKEANHWGYTGQEHDKNRSPDKYPADGDCAKRRPERKGSPNILESQAKQPSTPDIGIEISSKQDWVEFSAFLNRSADPKAHLPIPEAFRAPWEDTDFLNR